MHMSSHFFNIIFNFYIGGDFVDIKNLSHSWEFIVGFPENSLDTVNDTVELTLYVTTTEVGPVPFVVETLLGFMYTGTATNNSTTVVQLDSSYQVRESNEINKGIRIYAGNNKLQSMDLTIRQVLLMLFWVCHVLGTD